MPKTTDGPLGEAYAARYLSAHGYCILEQNYHSRFGEIDIIAQKDDVIAFVEVKTRRRSSWQSPAAAVTVSKQRKIILTAEHYLQQHPTALLPRFDVVALTTSPAEEFRVIQCEHLKGAFDLNAANGFF